LSNDIEAVTVKLPKYGGNELLEVDGTVSVPIEDLEYLVGLRARAPNSVVVEGLPELLEVQLATGVRVHYLELALEADQALGSTLDKLLPEATDYQIVLFLVGLGPKRFLLLVGGKGLGRVEVLGVLGVDVRVERIPG
jgi:hypothetical protein